MRRLAAIVGILAIVLIWFPLCVLVMIDGLTRIDDGWRGLCAVYGRDLGTVATVAILAVILTVAALVFGFSRHTPQPR